MIGSAKGMVAESMPITMSLAFKKEEKQMDKIDHKLIQNAGLTNAILQISKHDPRFKKILNTMQVVYEGKQVLYGDYIENNGADKLALTAHFCDIKRKYVRAENIVKRHLDGDIGAEELMDTYLDIAVYGAIGVLLLQHMEAVHGRESTGKTKTAG